MAHIFDYSLTICGDETKSDVVVMAGVRDRDAVEKMYVELQNAGHDCFIEQALIHLDEQMIVTQLMNGGWGDWTMGYAHRASPNYDYKQCMVKQARTFGNDLCWRAMAYIHVAKMDGDETRWKLLPEGIEHYLENYKVSKHMADHLSGIARLRGDWLRAYNIKPLEFKPIESPHE